MKPNY